MATECLCSSCRQAAMRLAELPLSVNMLTEYGATPYAEYRKDCFRAIEGAENLKEFRLTSESSTKRVIASCCNTPMFLDFEKGHWLSVYLNLLPEEIRPEVEMRTMTGDLPDTSLLPKDVPNLKTHNFTFFRKLLYAWFLMGFRRPKILVAGKLEIK